MPWLGWPRSPQETQPAHRSCATRDGWRAFLAAQKWQLGQRHAFLVCSARTDALAGDHLRQEPWRFISLFFELCIGRSRKMTFDAVPSYRSAVSLALLFALLLVGCGSGKAPAF